MAAGGEHRVERRLRLLGPCRRHRRPPRPPRRRDLPCPLVSISIARSHACFAFSQHNFTPFAVYKSPIQGCIAICLERGVTHDGRREPVLRAVCGRERQRNEDENVTRGADA